MQEQADDDSWRTSEDEGEGEDGDGEMHEDGEDQSDATDMKDVSDMDNKDATGQDNQNGNWGIVSRWEFIKDNIVVRLFKI